MNVAQYSHELAGSPIVGVTGTYYPDMGDVRFELSLETAEGWRDKGLPLVIVDGTPTSEDGGNEAPTAAAYRQRGAVVLRSEINGIATQRQQGARHVLAHGGNNILTHEPEKTLMPYFATNVADQLEVHDIVVVGRTKDSLESLPPVQQRTESLAGWILEETLALPADALAGPRGYSIDGVQNLLKYPSDMPGMNNLIYMYKDPLEARAAGQSVGGMEANIIYPESMVAQESGNPVFDAKRYMQFGLQLNYLLRLPEVRPEALALAERVLAGLSNLPVEPTNADQEAMLSALEVDFASNGYRTRR